MRKKFENDIQPTPKQKRYLDERLKQKVQGRTNKKEAAIKAGYSESAATSVKISIEGKKGFQMLLNERGLDDATLLTYLSEDLKNKPRERLGELKLASEITGLKENKLKIVSGADEGVALLKRLIDED